MTKEEAIGLKQSLGWESLCKEIDGQIEGCRIKLETESISGQILRLQERIKALKGLKNLPQDIADREEV